MSQEHRRDARLSAIKSMLLTRHVEHVQSLLLSRQKSKNPSNVVQSEATGTDNFSLFVQTIKWLWEAVHEFNAIEQRHFLKFFTGSDRAPIGGLGNQRCVIQVLIPLLSFQFSDLTS